MKLGFKSLFIISFVLFLSACTDKERVSMPLSLATFTENDVEVSIFLNSYSGGGYLLSATFTPLDGFHMYSKDIPMDGVNGLGRPTLLELTAESQMIATGDLMESIPAQPESNELIQLLVYPPGAVTLSLPVELPAGNDWVEDVVKITYMSCNDHGCKAPVVGKLVSVRVPGVDRAE